MSFPILIENSEAIGELRGEPVRVSTLAATSLLLASRGVNTIILPTPSDTDRLIAERGLLALPPERRATIRLVDQDGKVLQRVRHYLTPLVGCVQKWPETAFVGFLGDFLYQVALAAIFKAAIGTSAVSVVRDFIPIIDPFVFQGEARFRFAELAALVCSYEPAALSHGALRTEIDTGSGLSSRLWHLIETAEFREVVEESGKLGWAEHPIVTIRHLRNVANTYLQTKEAATLFKSASTIAGVGAKAHPSLEVAKASADVLANFTESREGYRPPFLPLGPSIEGIYRMALSNFSTDAQPVRDTIFSFATYKDGKEGISWLNIGEKGKLEREAADLESSTMKWEEAQKALARIF